MKADVHLLLTADGSHTVVNEVLGKSYHSLHGAWQESQRVYIELGLLAAFERFTVPNLSVFEMGFGTGLNALLTAREALTQQRRVTYTTVEAYPLPLETARQINYDSLLQTDCMTTLHGSPWNESVVINPYFSLTKVDQLLADFRSDARFHLIYYDAFAPSAQPELWEPAVFEQLASLLLPGGILTTYCSKSYIQRNMRSAGLTVEKHPGPWGKREVIRAIR